MALVVGPSLATCSFPRVCIAVYVRRKFQRRSPGEMAAPQWCRCCRGLPKERGTPTNTKTEGNCLTRPPPSPPLQSSGSVAYNRPAPLRCCLNQRGGCVIASFSAPREPVGRVGLNRRSLLVLQVGPVWSNSPRMTRYPARSQRYSLPGRRFCPFYPRDFRADGILPNRSPGLTCRWNSMASSAPNVRKYVSGIFFQPPTNCSTRSGIPERRALTA